MKAIKHDVAIYAIHTNLDVLWGANAKVMEVLDIKDHAILSPMKDALKKFEVYVPIEHVEALSKPFLKPVEAK